eukprot:29797-Pelagococcus_subviridis.AAC.7
MSSAAYPSSFRAGIAVSSSIDGGPHRSATVLSAPLSSAAKQCSLIMALFTRPVNPVHAVVSAFEIVYAISKRSGCSRRSRSSVYRRRMSFSDLFPNKNLIFVSSSGFESTAMIIWSIGATPVPPPIIVIRSTLIVVLSTVPRQLPALWEHRVVVREVNLDHELHGAERAVERTRRVRAHDFFPGGGRDASQVQMIPHGETALRHLRVAAELKPLFRIERARGVARVVPRARPHAVEGRRLRGLADQRPLAVHLRVRERELEKVHRSCDRRRRRRRRRLRDDGGIRRRSDRDVRDRGVGVVRGVQVPDQKRVELFPRFRAVHRLEVFRAVRARVHDDARVPAGVRAARDVRRAVVHLILHENPRVVLRVVFLDLREREDFRPRGRRAVPGLLWRFVFNGRFRDARRLRRDTHRRGDDLPNLATIHVAYTVFARRRLPRSGRVQRVYSLRPPVPRASHPPSGAVARLGRVLERHPLAPLNLHDLRLHAEVRVVPAPEEVPGYIARLRVVCFVPRSRGDFAASRERPSRDVDRPHRPAPLFSVRRPRARARHARASPCDAAVEAHLHARHRSPAAAVRVPSDRERRVRLARRNFDAVSVRGRAHDGVHAQLAHRDVRVRPPPFFFRDLLGRDVRREHVVSRPRVRALDEKRRLAHLDAREPLD